MITLSHLSKSFGDLVAVDDLSLTINQGEILGFLGPNGAGKTTSIRMLCGLLEPDSGKILWDGGANTPGSDVGLCPQENIYWPRLTCVEQLIFAGETYGIARNILKSKAIELLESLGLLEKQDQRAEQLSGGMKRRLNIALALIHDPPVLILDEPEAGLDPQSRVLIRELIRSLAREKTIILTTHNMDEAERLADRVAIIDHGKLLRVDSVENLKQLTGAGDLVEIELQQTYPSEQALTKALSLHLGEGCQVSWIDKRLQIRSEGILTRIATITHFLEHQNLVIAGMQLRRNTLEDVFIHLTGRGLRE